MSVLTIRRMLERRLNAMPSTLQTAFENTKTTQSIPYQRAFLLPSTTINAGISDRVHSRDIGFMQVSLFYPVGNGMHDAATQAERIRAHFPAGYTEVENGVQLVITQKPYIAAAGIEDGVLSLAVSIYYEATEI